MPSWPFPVTIISFKVKLPVLLKHDPSFMFRIVHQRKNQMSNDLRQIRSALPARASKINASPMKTKPRLARIIYATRELKKVPESPVDCTNRMSNILHPI